MKTLIPALAAALTIGGGLAATPAEASSRVVIHYGDGHGYRDAPRYRDRDRDGIPNRYDRYDNRRGDWRGQGFYHGPRHSYRHASRCWTEWRYDRWQDRRVKVRVCR